MLNSIKKRHILLLCFLGIICVFAIFYHRNDDNKNTFLIRTFDKEADFQALVKLVNDNKYWMSENPDFSPEKMFLTKAPSSAPEKINTVTIDVIEVKGQTAGFVAFYKKSPLHGYIWQLAIDKTFRGHGYGEQLGQHAINSLKKLGAQYITLTTRLINKPARSLYEKLGFIEKSRDEERGIIHFIKHNP